MIYFFYAIHVVVCIFLILAVLLQQGKGADLSVFGGGGTMTAFGARGAATLLHKVTVSSFVAFIVTTLAIGILQSQEGSSSVMSDVAVSESAATDDGEAQDTEPVAALPEDEPAADSTAADSTAADSTEADSTAAEPEGVGEPGGEDTDSETSNE